MYHSVGSLMITAEPRERIMALFRHFGMVASIGTILNLALLGSMGSEWLL